MIMSPGLKLMLDSTLHQVAVKNQVDLDKVTVAMYENYIGDTIDRLIDRHFEKDVTVIAWFYNQFHIEVLKDMQFGIEGNLWTYEEYEKLGVSAVRGISPCVKCGKSTNVALDTTQEFVCSKNCLDSIKYKK